MTVAFFCGLIYGGAPAFAGEKPAGSAGGETGREKTAPPADDEVVITLKASLMQPLFSSYPVAVVNGEPITLDDVKDALATSHEKRMEAKRKQSIDFDAIVQRLITAKLVIQEAKAMGLDELPEVVKQVDVFARQTLREYLLREKTKDVPPPNPAQIERRYQELARVWRIRSVLFEKEADAKKMTAEITGGKDYAVAMAEAVREKKAKGGEEDALMNPEGLHPQIAAALAAMKPGGLSPVIKLELKKGETGYAVLKFLAVEHPENPALRTQAEQEAGARKKAEVLTKFGQALLKKYGTVKWKTLDTLDYNAPKPGLAAFLKDKRVVATIKGEKPITVAELTGTLREQFFHGMERRAEAKKIDPARKADVLFGMLEQRLFRKEALRLGLDKRDDYLKEVRAYQESILFGVFVQKAVLPDVKISQEDIRAYYDEHKKDFTSPEMMRMRSLVFTKKEQAEDALEKLRKGTDFNWLASNAEGQVDKSTAGLQSFDGALLTTTSMPEGVRKAVAGAKSGDVRYYGAPEGHYALLVQQVVSSQLEPLDAVQADIAKKAFDKKLMQSVEDWARKLKESGEVKIYLSVPPGV